MSCGKVALRGWGFGLLIKMAIIQFSFFGEIAKGQSMEPATSLLCISECSTCPVICSPPPSPDSPSQPPPISPSLSNQYSPPPPPPTPHTHQSPTPPPPPPPSPSPSPLTPPPSSSSPAQPPPTPTYQTTPSGTSPSLPTVMSNYTNPYYYFYASQAAPVSQFASLPPLLVVLLAGPLMLLCSG